MICRKSDCFACPWPECRNDYVKPRYQTTEEARAKMRVYGKTMYRERKASGLCVRCGKRPAKEGRVRCWYCLQADARAHGEASRAAGVVPRFLFDGVTRCMTCGKEEVLSGHKLCRSCYEKNCATLKIARAARGKNELWDRLNSALYMS